MTQHGGTLRQDRRHCELDHYLSGVKLSSTLFSLLELRRMSGSISNNTCETEQTKAGRSRFQIELFWMHARCSRQKD
jgi:hypothetical protein